MSIAEAITNAQNRVKAAYATCKDKGATLPDVQDLANLPETIDSVKSGGIEVVQAYYNDTDIEVGKKVLLTNVGYQATGSSTLSPEVRVSFISENGYAGEVVYYNYPIYIDRTLTQRYDIIDGSVDSSTGRTAYTGSYFYVGNRIIPFFLNNGAVFIEGNSQRDYYGLQRDNAYTVVCYNYNTTKKSGSIGSTFGLGVLETGFFSCSNQKIWKIDNDLNETSYDTGMPSIRTTYVIEDEGSYYFYYDTASYRKTWTLAKGQIAEDVLTVTDIKTDTYAEALPFTFVHSEENNNPHILLQCKQRITTDNGFMKFIIHALGYMCFDINSEDETQSVISTHGWSESSLAETIGNRTIYKMQAFYDGTFSIDLSDGTTLICEFTRLKTVNCLEIIEPFIVEGSTTIYHRTFSETRMYWYQRPEGTATNSNITVNAPISSNPYGPYNATRAVTNYLAVDFLENRFNSTVLTGFLTGQVDTIGGRDVVGVKTATKGTTLIDYSDVINCYVSGVALGQPELNSMGTELEPSSVCDVDVLLTNVGYQATGSSTLSPSVRVSLLTENGYAAYATNSSSYAIQTSGIHDLRYDIVDGVVNANSGYRNTSGTVEKRGQLITWFYKNGTTVVEGIKNTSGKPMGFAGSGSGAFVFYTYDVFYGGAYLLPSTNCTVLTDDGYISNSTSKISLVLYKDDNINISEYESFSLSDYLTGNVLNTDIFGISDGDTIYYIYYPKDSSYQNWELAKCVLNREDGTVTTSSLFTNTLSGYTPIASPSGNLVFECKGKVDVEGGFNKYLICADRYIKFHITPNGVGSTVEINSYPQNILDDIGNRTIYKMQCFYDNTFSFDLSDGTTLMCGFSNESGEPEIQEIIEPFIIEGNSNIYHRTFTANKIYWYQRPEGSTPSTSSGGVLIAPISSKPYGPYNATKATVDWLAIPREQNRWNTTVLTGVIRQSAQLAKPVFDDTGRRVLQVETTIKKNNCNDNATYEWTLEDYNRVNG